MKKLEAELWRAADQYRANRLAALISENYKTLQI